MPNQDVFHKTERGKVEMTRRTGDLAPATRRVLIMVNGVDSVAALMARGGVHELELHAHLSRLLELELIAPVPIRTQALPAKPAARPSQPPAHEAPPDPRIDDQCRVVLAILQEHFGPNATDVAQDMLMARTAAEFNAAIDQIEYRMIGHLGRKHALRETQGMRLA